MKKTICTIILIVATVLSYCQSPAEKVIIARDNVQAAEENLKLAKQQLIDTYPAYIKDAQKQIHDNDVAIKCLRVNMIKPRWSPSNTEAKKKIEDLVNRNGDLRNRLYIQ